jgi:hypothetical protein
MTILQLGRLLVLCALLAACSQQVAGDKVVLSYEGVAPLDLSGSWERDFARGDIVSVEVDRVLRQIQRRAMDPGNGYNNRMGTGSGSDTRRKISTVLALAQLADMITRVDTLKISQSEHQINIARKGDFAISCEFYDGAARGPATDYGNEVCGWDGHQFVSRLVLPDGLRVTHRFTMSADGKSLHVATTVSSRASSTPFTLDRYYNQFERPASEFNCIETLSMKRVCSTGEIKR